MLSENPLSATEIKLFSSSHYLPWYMNTITHKTLHKQIFFEYVPVNFDGILFYKIILLYHAAKTFSSELFEMVFNSIQKLYLKMVTQ